MFNRYLQCLLHCHLKKSPPLLQLPFNKKHTNMPSNKPKFCESQYKMIIHDDGRPVLTQLICIIPFKLEVQLLLLHDEEHWSAHKIGGTDIYAARGSCNERWGEQPGREIGLNSRELACHCRTWPWPQRSNHMTSRRAAAPFNEKLWKWTSISAKFMMEFISAFKACSPDSSSWSCFFNAAANRSNQFLLQVTGNGNENICSHPRWAASSSCIGRRRTRSLNVTSVSLGFRVFHKDSGGVMRTRKLLWKVDSMLHNNKKTQTQIQSRFKHVLTYVCIYM